MESVQARAEATRGFYNRYSQPLGADAANLLWRLDESLLGDGGEYLRADAPMTTFTHYKRLITCYRIAAILDWIRAIRRESSLFFGRVDDQIQLAIAECESALADRPAVEDNALKKLAQLWQLTLPGNSESVTRLSKQMHRSVEQCLSVNGLNQSHELTAIGKVSGLEAARHFRIRHESARILTVSRRCVVIHMALSSSTCWTKGGLDLSRLAAEHRRIDAPRGGGPAAV